MPRHRRNRKPTKLAVAYAPAPHGTGLDASGVMISSHDGADLPWIMAQLAGRLAARLDGQAGLHRTDSPALPSHTPGLVWQNWLFSGPVLRQAHVELFEIPGHFAVVHLCLLPHVHDPAPILGFDMIAGRTQATGIFLDFSQIRPDLPGGVFPAPAPHAARARFRHQRPRPDWGTVFSEDFLAIRPEDDGEVLAALTLAEGALDLYLATLSAGVRPQFRDCARQGQLDYARAQRSNPHTFRMLARHVGAQPARRFIDTVLFPQPA
jgi:hypothetical protein